MIAQLLAQIADSITPTTLLVGANGVLTIALGKIYRDCQKDRTDLWAHIRALEKRMFGK